jgi:CubicO group peptidase (beta-lactamase class C family)
MSNPFSYPRASVIQRKQDSVLSCRSRLCRLVGILAIYISSLQIGHDAARADATTARVDKLFSQWNRKDSPGCAVAVMRDGKIVHKRGYGMADLEHAIPIKPNTIFHIASTSKQFTAFCIVLLERDGKLKLDDDVRKYLPELHDFGKTITIRHLLNHTSGLRDQWSLLTLAGWRMDDVITEEDILGLVWRQKELNSEPGARFNYCNTGYTLAAKIVERVSGKPMPQFAEERIFKPLGMSRTHFHLDYEEIVKDRALSYSHLGEGKFKNAILSYGNVGATSLFTTVEDLAKWDRNFYDGGIGGIEALAAMHVHGKLNDGKEIPYALGLGHGKYRGLKTVEHAGGDAGYRCTLLRFPTEKFSVAVLSNHGEFDPEELARRVADVYLADNLKPQDKPAVTVIDRKEVKVDPGLFEAYLGEYRLFPGVNITIARENSQLTIQATGQPKVPLYPSSEIDFFVKVNDVTVTFARPVSNRCEKLIVHQYGEDLPADRIVRRELSAQDAAEYVGDYYSAELGVIYSITAIGNKLQLRHPRATFELQPESADVMDAPFPVSRLNFARGADKKVSGFKIDAGRVTGVRFTKADLRPIGG